MLKIKLYEVLTPCLHNATGQY